MASTSLAFFSALTTLTTNNKQSPSTLLFSRIHTTCLTPTSSLSSQKFNSSSALSSGTILRRSKFSSIPKFSESEAPVMESEPDPQPTLIAETTGEDPTEIAEPTKEVPKREEVFAVVMIGSRQYIVFPGRYIHTQRLKGANLNDKIILNKVLLVGTKTSTYIGKPILPNAAVHAVVEEQGLNPKVIVFKYKKKKNYRRNIGHRQPNTRIRIVGITGYQDSPAVTLDS